MIELNKIYCEDCLKFLKKLPDNSIDCCVTSPPYYGLRDYKHNGQIGLERTPELYVERLIKVFGEIKRVLNQVGTLWLNVGDSYFGSGQGYGDTKMTNKNHNGSRQRIKPKWNDCGLKSKDLIGIPWMVAFALRADGWYLRQDIIWSKPNPMPESVTDRCTKSHEYIFLMSKSAQYYYNAESIKTMQIDHSPNESHFSDAEKKTYLTKQRAFKTPDGWDTGKGSHGSFHKEGREKGFKGYKHRGKGDKKLTGHSGYYDSECNLIGEGKANKRSVWTVPTMPFKEAHFATFPEDLIIPCIKAGCPENGIVLDPFMGAGTTALVSHKLNRNWIGSEINPEYCKIAEKRIEPYLMQQTIKFQ